MIQEGSVYGRESSFHEQAEGLAAMTLLCPLPDENGWVSTLNDRGYMSLSFDPYTQEFLQLCQGQPGLAVLEAGAAYGHASLAALKAGAKVTANDMDPRHLAFLEQRTPLPLRPNLKLCPGELPQDVDCLPESYDAILCARMLHFLTGEQLKRCLEKFYSWLKTGGRAFLIAETPYLGCYADFIPVYEERKRQGRTWPGLLEDTTAFRKIR